MASTATSESELKSRSDLDSETLEVTILMPCLNEAETVALCVTKAMGFLKSAGVSGEVLIADNGSTDNSTALAEAAGARVIHVADRGYGAALISGIEDAYGKFVIMGDADDSYDFEKLGPFVEGLRAGHDLVMGNRFEGGISKGAMPFLHRYLGNPVLSALGRLLFSTNTGDFHCGLRGFRRQAILDLKLRSTGMEFASEMIVKSVLNELSIVEVPTTLSPDGRSHKPHLRTWRDGWRHLRFLLLHSPRWLFLYPGLALFTIGLVSMIILQIGPVRVAGLTFDVHTLLVAAGTFICGFQLIALAVLAEKFASDERILPRQSKLLNLADRFPLEIGIFLGALLLLAGFLTSIGALIYWSQADFGPLMPTEGMRIVIPSVTAVIMGTQITFFSFFLGVLRLREK